MNSAHTLPAPLTHCLKLILAGSLAAAMTACSTSKPPVVVSRPVGGMVRPAALQTVISQPAPVVPVKTATVAAKPPASKLVVYRSRDYGVSFSYPWQYRFVSAKTMAAGDSSVQPDSAHSEDWFALARVEIPKGFYPDSDLDRGYFALRLNQRLNEQECGAGLNASDGKLATDTINGVDYRWTESDSGGHGSALKLRDYVAYINGTCFEVEMGVKTSNRDGLARELDPEQVMTRLDAILRTVKLQPAMKDAAPAVVDRTAAAQN